VGGRLWLADLEKRVPSRQRRGSGSEPTSIALTSAAVGPLLEKNTLVLDDKIQTYAPEIPEKDWP
jgi:hypothetical protein